MRIDGTLPVNEHLNWCFEFAYRRESASDYHGFLWAGNGINFSLKSPNSFGDCEFMVVMYGQIALVSTTKADVGVWRRVAVSSADNGNTTATLRIFVDGDLGGTAIVSAPTISGAYNIGRTDQAGFSGLGGYLDEYLITLGQTKHTASYTPLDRAFPDVAC